MKKKKKFTSVVFAGGGTRCFWQAGFWSVVKPELNLKPDAIGCVSAGATVACMCMGGKIEEGISYFKDITGKNKKNMYAANFFSSKPVMPHYDMYRDAIVSVMDKKSLKTLHGGPDIRVLMAHPPRFLGARSGTMIGILSYSIEKQIVYPVHSSFTRKLGYTSGIVSVKECETVDDLAHLLLCSSCTPPMVPILRYNKRVALDGGLVDNVPVHTVEDVQGETLVLLTRKYREEKIPLIPGRTYVQPTEPIKINKWDYTNPDLLQVTFEEGKRDGEKFLSTNHY